MRKTALFVRTSCAKVVDRLPDELVQTSRVMPSHLAIKSELFTSRGFVHHLYSAYEGFYKRIFLTFNRCTSLFIHCLHTPNNNCNKDNTL